MGDLVLKGLLNLKGMLKLSGDSGGKVKVDTFEVLVEVTKGQAGASQGQGAPVILPPPPAAPIDTGVDAWIFKSFNATVTAGGKNIVTMGMYAQGNPGTATWPGMLQPSMMNPTVTINNIAINVVGDMGTTLPTGTPVTFSQSGQ
jgi:hypothetical protein